MNQREGGHSISKWHGNRDVSFSELRVRFEPYRAQTAGICGEKRFCNNTPVLVEVI